MGASGRTHGERQIVRLTGWILLLIGLLLCATIAWAALGFLLMGIGLIALQVGERRKHRARVAVAAPAGFTPPVVGAGLQPPTLDSIPHDTPPARQPRRVAWPDKKGGGPYDKEAWRRLVEGDPDLARLAKVLADYGPQYVDELAASYLAAPDKSRLGAIVDGIIARARGGQPVPPPAAPAQGSRPPPLPRPEPKPAIKPEDTRPAAAPPPVPANPADALEASLIAAVEEASAKAAAERADPPKPARAAESRPPLATRREPAFRSAPSDPKPVELPPALPASPSADLEASLIAAVAEASAKRADPPKPPPPERPPVATKREPEVRIAPREPKPAPPPPARLAIAPADDLDESLLAALAEISGQKRADPSEPDTAAKDAPAPPADDGLTEMIKKFAPDSSFLKK